jgi:pimeloyl-ACP methyl ester carboxylesterase
MQSHLSHAILLLLALGKLCLLTAESQSSNLRQFKYTARTPQASMKWQEALRERLFKILKINDLVDHKQTIPFAKQTLVTEDRGPYTQMEIEINSTKTRRIQALVTIPQSQHDPFPAVVCIHGHGGVRHTVHDASTIYKGFAAALAKQNYVTIAVNVGQHNVYEAPRILMGERLWDLMRCVDFLCEDRRVDSSRIGCAGLSLGGEMAMWLAAMDPRIRATVSSGFLTTMDQMEQNHCMCWKFPGLRELVDYADIYSLIAPRALQCQNGLKEGPRDFYVPLARKAMQEIKVIYMDLDQADNVELDIHEGGHEIDLPNLLTFTGKHLKPSHE